MSAFEGEPAAVLDVQGCKDALSWLAQPMETKDISSGALVLLPRNLVGKSSN